VRKKKRSREDEKKRQFFLSPLTFRFYPQSTNQLGFIFLAISYEM
jgi:hypothetical protein